MPNFDRKQQSLVRLIQARQDVNWEEGDRHPIIQVTVTSDYEGDIVTLMDCGYITECLLDGSYQGTNTENIQNIFDKTVSFELQLPLPKNEFACVRNLNTLLQYKQYLNQIPTTVLFIEDNSFNVPDKYIDTVAFANLLKMISDHHDTDGDKLTCLFYDGVKVAVIVTYSAGDTLELTGMKELRESFIAPRLKERVRIFRSAVIKTAMTSPSELSNFPHLLKNFHKIKITYEQDWNLYVSDFSLDDVLEGLEGKILSIADKLSGALADLQKTMIAIPLAIIFAAPRIETTNIQTITNGIIVASVWIFALFTWTFFSNHKRTLKFIFDEIEEQKTFVEEKHPGVADKIKTKFNGLKTRGDSQRNYRRVIGSLMWVAVIGITSLYFFPQLKALVNFLKNIII